MVFEITEIVSEPPLPEIESKRVGWITPAQGKAASSQNALKHGLLARDAVLPDEDPAEFEAQLAALEDALLPEDALEQELVRQMADAQWRMRRLTCLETGYLAACLFKSNQRVIHFEPGSSSPDMRATPCCWATPCLAVQRS